MIAAAVPGSMPTGRILLIIDLNSGLRLPIGSGAETSLIHPKYPERLTPNSNTALPAVYRSNIETYGQKFLKLHLGIRRTFR